MVLISFPKVPWSLEQQTSLSPILWSGESFPQSRFSISPDRSGDAVFILNGTLVTVMYITCSDLYKTCEELSQGGWMDPLSCVWCPDEQRQVMVTLDDELPCASPITRVCPPTVYHVGSSYLTILR
ncbi:hypothetical protein GCK32_011802 [Trichostrongylus colubriformis]|uniref:Uncharacterized protein n=1 Tax=Trichostrongylus colubriformis TaxID=6319 RepID=A0AAN8FLE5_TRICO